MSDLGNRKKLLIAEGEVYRATLKMELQNLRLYGLKTRQKVTSFRGALPLLSYALPFVTSLFGRSRTKRRRSRWAPLAAIGLQLYRRLAPGLAEKFFGPRVERPAAEEYLAKRM